MKNKIMYLGKLGMLACLFTLFTTHARAACHPYIEQLSNGDLKFTVSFNAVQYYVEVFIKKNGIQTIAQNIVSSQVQNSNGTYSYSYIYPASNFVNGDKILTRFYSYMFNSPGVFTPGPEEFVWAPEFTYGEDCPSAIYVSVNGSDSNAGTKTSPVKTIAKGVSLASAQGLKEVRVAEGTYEEGNIVVANGVSLLGGYSSDFSARDITFTNYVTTIDANQPTGYMVCGEKRILYIKDIYLSTIIEGFVMTRGRMCAFGGGIYANNANQLVIIRNNKIINNSSVGNGTSAGGNVYIENGCPQLYNNMITGGFSGGGFGNDLYIASTSPYCKPIVNNNTFTNEAATYGLDKAIRSGNMYLNQNYVYVSTAGNNANIGTDEAPVQTVEKGIALAVAKGATQVRIATGTYVEGNLNVANGVSIYGGYSSDFSMWNPSSIITTIDAQQSGGMYVCGSKRVFKAENITSYTTISGLTIKGGRLCDYGGGIYINNCSDKLVIQNNKINGNSSVGNGTSAGGNIYIGNSSAKLLYNEITNGFAGAGFGNEIYISGIYSDGTKSEIAYNTITSSGSPSIYGTSDANIHDNTYLTSPRTGTTTNLYLPLEVKMADDVLLVTSDDENINVEVIDAMGKSFIKSHSKETNLSGLATGLYIIKAENASSAVTEKVYVK